MKYQLYKISAALAVPALFILFVLQLTNAQHVTRHSEDDLAGNWDVDCNDPEGSCNDGHCKHQYEISRNADGSYTVYSSIPSGKYQVRKVGFNEYVWEGENDAHDTNQRFVIKIENGQLVSKFFSTGKMFNDTRLEFQCNGYRASSSARVPSSRSGEDESKGGALGSNDCLSVSTLDANDVPPQSIASKYDSVRPFSDGLAAVGAIPRGERNAKWGFIGRNGWLVIPLRYDVVTPFNGGLAGVGGFPRNNTSPGVYFEGDLSAKWNVIDRSGQIVGERTPLGWDAVKILGEGFAAVGYKVPGQLSLKWNLINSQGITLQRRYDSFDCFVRGRARASFTATGMIHTGYVDTSGRFIEDANRR